jgi:hypothetical protein
MFFQLKTKKLTKVFSTFQHSHRSFGTQQKEVPITAQETRTTIISSERKRRGGNIEKLFLFFADDTDK